ncbi:MAG: pyridoxal 5'-phosphate synthase glutaminase subunit PdxT [Nitrososphaeraceae archaeon]
MTTFNIGVLGIQGDIEENIISTQKALNKLNMTGNIFPVKYYQDLLNLDSLIIPGGESTVISSLLSIDSKFQNLLKDKISEGIPVLGTCAGMILLAKHAYDKITGDVKYQSLDVLDVVVERNSFGRQHDSFEVNLDIPMLGTNYFKGIFIRAPVVTKIGNKVDIIASIHDKIVAVKQNNLIGTSFHPELSNDFRFHEFLIKETKKFKEK